MYLNHFLGPICLDTGCLELKTDGLRRSTTLINCQVNVGKFQNVTFSRPRRSEELFDPGGPEILVIAYIRQYKFLFQDASISFKLEGFA